MIFYLIKQNSLFLFVVFFTLIGCNQPQPKEPDQVRRKSPIAIAKVKHQPSDTYMKIVYGQPYKRDRDIFGNVVPYDEVWRTGANEATELTTTQPIKFGGKELPSGTYTLFSIPHEENQWTIILNEELGQWGAFEYDESKDIMRVQVPSMQKETVTEAFSVEFSEVHNDSTNIVMQWDRSVVKIPIKFTSTTDKRSEV